MKEFLNSLKKSANKYLDKHETNELVSYYEEIINDRLDNNENIEDVLKDYNIEEIIKEYLPNAILKRNKYVFKNSFQVLLLLFSTPILIPLALVYLAIVIVFLVLFISFIVASFSGILLIVPYLIEVFEYTNGFAEILGLASMGVFGVTLIVYISFILSKIFYEMFKWIIKAFLKVFMKKRGQHETH